jgi:hypothetical protein
MSRLEAGLRIRRVLSALVAGALWFGSIIRRCRQIFWFYPEHLLRPLEKYGVLTPLHWQDSAFLAALLVLAIAFVQAPDRLRKHATRTDRTAVVS